MRPASSASGVAAAIHTPRPDASAARAKGARRDRLKAESLPQGDEDLRAVVADHLGHDISFGGRQAQRQPRRLGLGRAAQVEEQRQSAATSSGGRPRMSGASAAGRVRSRTPSAPICRLALPSVIAVLPCAGIRQARAGGAARALFGAIAAA